MNHVTSLTRAIEDAARHLSLYDTFADFLETSLHDFGVPVPAEWKQRTDIDFTGVIQRYRLAVYETEPLRDILGLVYMELGAHGHRNRLGQYFTPWSIASMMAEMQLSGEWREDGEDLIRICDPACGSGVMLLAMVDAIRRRHGSRAVERLSLTGVDIDWICARMAALQLAANNAIHGLRFGEIGIVHGDSIRLEGFSTVLHATARPRITRADDGGV